MKRFIILSLFGILMLVAVVNAEVVCSPQSITSSFTEGQIPLSQTITCTNTNQNSSVIINKYGSYFSTTPNFPATINPGEANKAVTINFDANAPVGNYLAGAIYFSDGSSPVSISMNVAKKQSLSSCSIDVFPSVMSNIKTTQNEVKTRNIQLTVPSCYPNTVNIGGVALQSDEKPIQLGEISIGNIQPGQSVMIPIVIDSTKTSTGTYSDKLQLLVYNTNGSKIDIPLVSISVTVTMGITPVVNFSVADLPTCSLNSIEMSLNESYKMTCSTNPNIEITPIIDSKFIKGVSVTETDSQYIYEFRPIQIGTTTISAEFLSRNAPIGSPYEQDIRISLSGGMPVAGVELELLFYQDGLKKEVANLRSGDTTVLVRDRNTTKIIPSFTLYLNGEKLNNTFSLKSGIEYELIADSQGYLSRIMNFTVSQTPVALIISPYKSFYSKGETVNISTNPENATLYLNGEQIANHYTFFRDGNFTLKAVKEGYLEGLENISVTTGVYIVDMFPKLLTEWKKGINVVVQLSQATNWNVNFGENTIASNNSNIVEFKLDDYGYYEIFADGEIISNYDFQDKRGWFSKNLLYVVIGVIALGVLMYFLFSKGSSEDVGFGGTINS